MLAERCQVGRHKLAMAERASKRWVLAAVMAIILIGLAMRLAAFQVGGGAQKFQSAYELDDGGCHTRIARALIEGYGYSRGSLGVCGNRPYLVPFLYAGYFYFSGGSIPVLLTFRMLEYLAGAAAVWYLGRVAFANQRAVPLITLLFYCANPYFAVFQIGWIEVGPVTIAYCLFVAESIRLWRSDRRWWLGGLAWGAAASAVYLSRPSLLACIGLIGLTLGIRFFVNRRQTKEFLRLATGALVLIAAMSSWIGRNYILFGEWILTRTDAPENIWKANHPQLERIYPLFTQDAFDILKQRNFEEYSRPEDPATYGRYVKVWDPPPVANARMREIHEFYQSHPWKRFERIPLKLWWSIDPRYVPHYQDKTHVKADENGDLHIAWDEAKARPAIQRLSHLVIWPTVMIGTLAGLWIAFRTTSGTGPIFLLCILGYLVLVVVSLPAVKNRLPVEVSWYPLVALPLALLWQRLRGKIPSAPAEPGRASVAKPVVSE
jgi:hypothetical protein